ncbi:MAG: hypothetical protein QM690_07600 [Sphingobium sp.]
MFPFTGLRLFLPAIMPSWRFFDAVTASPRVDYAVLSTPDEPDPEWREVRPRPPVLTFGTMLRHLLWNAEWNENLYLVSLSERLMSASTAATEFHSQRELLLRVSRHLDRHGVCDHDAYLQTRLRFVSRNGPADQVGTRSPIFPSHASAKSSRHDAGQRHAPHLRDDGARLRAAEP